MWMNPDEARSDFILAAATAVLGPFVVNLVADLPFYPSFDSLLFDLLRIVWIFSLSGLVPLLLVRYRDQGLAGFGLGADRSGVSQGLLLAAPILVIGVLRTWSVIPLPRALFGRLGLAFGGNPVINGDSTSAALDLTLTLVELVAAFAGLLLLFTFLTTRARDGFRQTAVTQVEALRTFGMATAAAALLLGGLNSLGGTTSGTAVLLNVGGLVAIILLADRLVSPGVETSRATVMAPALVALLLHVVRGGGLFSSNLAFGLYAGAMAAGVAIAIAVLVETKRFAWAVVPAAAMMVLYPTCLSPLNFGTACG